MIVRFLLTVGKGLSPHSMELSTSCALALATAPTTGCVASVNEIRSD